MWHDGMPGRGHAGERKVAYGMTGLLEEVMPERRKVAYGMTGCREEVMPERRKKAYGMTSMGTGTPEKEKQTKFRRFPTPSKRKTKKYYFSY